MKQNQNPRHSRQGRPNQKNNQRRGGKPRHNNANRNQQPTSLTKQVDSRGPAGNQRGNAKQLCERYMALATERKSADRQEYENLMQHADHYYRIFAEFTAIETAKQAQRDKDQAKKAEREQKTVHNGASENPKQSTADHKPAAAVEAISEKSETVQT